MPSKILRIDGLPEASAFLSNFPTSLKSGFKTEFNTIADTGVKTMQGSAHVRTGKMKSGIKKGTVSDTKAEIVASVGYSGYENKRGNPHNFFDTSIPKIEQDAKTKITNMINSKITSRGK